MAYLPQPFGRSMTWLILLTLLGPLTLPVFGPSAHAQIRPAPIARDDAYRVAPGGTLQIAAPGVLENDQSPTGTPLKAILVDNVSQGTLTLNADGSLTYRHARNQPTADADSMDRFTYQATDGAQLSTTATVTLTITPDDHPPRPPWSAHAGRGYQRSQVQHPLVANPDGGPRTRPVEQHPPLYGDRGSSMLAELRVTARRNHPATPQPATAPVIPTGDAVCGFLTEDTTWTAAASPYVLTCDVMVPSGVTLTIAPGTVIKGATGAELIIFADGHLIAAGTPAEPIVFTSLNDTDYGGDTNGDADTAPAPGDWGGIELRNNRQSTLEQLLIQYASAGITMRDRPAQPASVVTLQHSQLRDNTIGLMAHLVSDAAVLTLRNNQIDANAMHGVILQGFPSQRATNPVITMMGNTITNNGMRGIHMFNVTANGLRLTIQDNAMSANQGEAIQMFFPSVMGTDPILYEGEIVVQGNTVRDNGTNAMTMGGVVYGSLTLDWGNTIDLPVVSPGTANVVVDHGSLLQLTPGMVYKENAGGLRVFGTLQAVGTPTRPIVFTSLRDDAHGGDTNGDGDFRDPDSGAVAPAPGDWYHLDFRAESSASQLEHVLITYAHRGVETRTSDLQITQSHVHANIQGLYVPPDSGAAPSRIVGNAFTAHTVAAIENAGTATIDARGNWWDDPSGPTHPTNPDGQGETIVGDVLFDPWLTSADEHAIIAPTAPTFPTRDDSTPGTDRTAVHVPCHLDDHRTVYASHQWDTHDAGYPCP